MINSMARSLITAKKWYRSMLAGNEAYSPGAYELISTTVLGSDTASVTFSSIVGTYKHLQIRMTGRISATSSLLGSTLIRLNGDTTAANYSSHFLRGSGSSVSSFAVLGSSGFYALNSTAGNGSSANIFGSAIIDILDYSSTSKYKTGRTMSGGLTSSTTTFIVLQSGLWMNTASVTSITLVDESANNFITGSRFSLYGIKG